ncbi:hypothetical protein GCM10011588_33650 [Nocardia jinanensis]|uniref:Aminoglycoside phosphotransferase domain-containing protein n=1 Tax=Nocardia jinanensis TaxID=382504 RepID=A0A917VUM9_9NOCA|nr:hypothetical protein GCM10011588_33650 [Nocardia jinanensis]
MLGAAAAIGLPVPAVITHESRRSRGFFVMEKVSGMIPLPGTVSRLIPDPARREDLGRQVARAMARLHGADPDSLGLTCLGVVPDAARTGAVENATWTRRYHEVADIRIPVLDLALAWLEHRPDRLGRRTSRRRLCAHRKLGP